MKQKIKEMQKLTENSIELDNKESITVEEIQNFVEKALQVEGHIDIAVAYSTYRKERTKVFVYRCG